MGRHSTGKNNYSLSGGLLAALVIALIAIIVAVWFFFFRTPSEDTASAPQCVSGELELPVAGNADVAQSLIDDYLATNPVVRDYCVTPTIVDDAADAAVVVAPDGPGTEKLLADAGRTASSANPSPVLTQAYGVSGGDVAAEDIDYSSAPNEMVAAAVANAVAGSPEAATQALETAGGEATITPVDGSDDQAVKGAEVTYYAFPLNASDSVTEDQARAATNLAEFAAENFDGEEATLDLPETVLAAASAAVTGQAAGAGASSTETTTAETTTESPQTDVVNTLFLVDTSAGMQQYEQPVAEAVGTVADQIIADGSEVALWNYSSPLNEGVTKSWRSNVQFTTEEGVIGQRAAAFGHAGLPNTRESVLAALGAVAPLDGNYRVVLITYGTNDPLYSGDDQAFIDAAQTFLDEGAQLSVVHVGGGEADASVAQLAETSVDAADGGAVADAVAQAAGVK